MNHPLCVGVIGHVDHGKTSLVKAISGIDTDRLKEEKERGMSIVLGFAYLDDEDGGIDLVDVPGHENFVRTMVAGATGIDAALLVVDINEGVKPQTIEHLAITQLIGVQRGAIAISKCDTADAAVRAAAAARLRRVLKGTYLADAPLVFTSTRTAEGLDELAQVLRQLRSGRVQAEQHGARFYLPVDRVFSMAGRGTVVTGTLRLGRIRVGDEVELMPGALRSTVRQLELHRREVGELLPGQRAGINLRHLKPPDFARGTVLSTPGMLLAASLLDVQLMLLPHPERKLKDGQTVRLLFGTTDVAAQVRVLGSDALQAGDAGFVQLRTARPVAAASGEPFILRLESPPMTIGGGRILDPAACRHRRSDPDVLQRLRRLAEGSRNDVLAERLKAAGYVGTTLAALALATDLPEAHVRAALASGIATCIDETQVLYRPFLDALGDMVCAALLKFHRQYPLRRGAPLSYCRSSLPRTVGENVFRFVMHCLQAGKRVSLQNGIASAFGFDPFSALNEREREQAASIEAAVKAGGFTPPDPDALTGGQQRAMELLYLLAERGSLLLLPAEQAGKKVVFHRDAISEAVRRMHEAFPPPTAFTVSELRALLGSTRKFTVPLLEYFDAAGYTRRRGDKRSATEDTEKRR